MNEITQYPVGSLWGVPMVKKPTVWGGGKMKKRKEYYAYCNGRFFWWGSNLRVLILRLIDYIGNVDDSEPITIIEMVWAWQDSIEGRFV